MWGPKEDIFRTVCHCPAPDIQKIQNLGSYVLEAQGSRKHNGEWPNKPGVQILTVRLVILFDSLFYRSCDCLLIFCV